MKRAITQILVLTFFFIQTTVKAEEANPFPGLKTIEVPSSIPSSRDPFIVRVHYDPAISELINKLHPSVEDEKHLYREEQREVLITKIDRQKPERYTVYYSGGISADPYFAISLAGTETGVGSLDGLEIYIPGNGSVYVAGHTNNYFNQHRKYTLESGKLVETKQPFYFVGLESRAKQDITISVDKAGDEKVASIPKGTKLTVLLNEDKYYLLKTQFGLVGWFTLFDSSQNDDVLEGIYFRGD